MRAGPRPGTVACGGAARPCAARIARAPAAAAARASAVGAAPRIGRVLEGERGRAGLAMQGGRRAIGVRDGACAGQPFPTMVHRRVVSLLFCLKQGSGASCVPGGTPCLRCERAPLRGALCPTPLRLAISHFLSWTLVRTKDGACSRPAEGSLGGWVRRNKTARVRAARGAAGNGVAAGPGCVGLRRARLLQGVRAPAIRVCPDAMA